MAFRKKQKDDAGLDVLDEIREPFSFANFFEEHVVERAKRIRRFLEEKGILFFLLSPFQQRNRLILQLAVIVMGLMLGIVPRSMNLLEQAKERNAASEMASLLAKKDSQVAIGSILVRPLGSSHYKRQHLLAFHISSASGDAVPSTPERYKVRLSVARGVTDPENVAYSYAVIPISEEGRILLVYTDNRKQTDHTGIYNLTVQAADDEIRMEEKNPFEVVLSDTQETNGFFGEKGIDLSVLTEQVLNDPNTPIAEAMSEYEAALEAYELEIERIENLPLDMHPVPAYEELASFTKDRILYEGLDDSSTTADAAKFAEVPDSDREFPEYPASIELGGVLYNAQYLEGLKSQASGADGAQDVASADGAADTEGSVLSGLLTEDSLDGVTLTEEEEAVFRELEPFQAKVNNVLSALEGLNSSMQAKYQTLKDYKLTLNQKVELSSFTGAETVSDLME